MECGERWLLLRDDDADDDDEDDDAHESVGEFVCGLIDRGVDAFTGGLQLFLALLAGGEHLTPLLLVVFVFGLEWAGAGGGLLVLADVATSASDQILGFGVDTVVFVGLADSGLIVDALACLLGEF